MRDWERGLPGGCEAKREMLRGIAVEASRPSRDPRKPPEAVFEYFPSNALPLDAGKRFESLFKFRGSWRHEDLIPYLADVTNATDTEPALLLKYTRQVREGDVRMYLPRH